MKRIVLLLAMTLILAALSPAAGLAAGSGSQQQKTPGELEWEVGAIWWDSEFGLSGGDDFFEEKNAGELGFRGELWLPQSFGFVAQYMPTDTSGMAPGAANVTYASLDAMYRLDTVGKNNYVALGAGWEFVDMTVSNEFGKTDGPRGVVSFRMGSKKAFGYGEYSYMWKMSRINVADNIDEDLRNIRGEEYEYGGGYIFGKHVQLRIGFRQTKFRMDRADGSKYSSVSRGYLAALAVVF